MEYNFDAVVDRNGTQSEKYNRDTLEKMFGNPYAIPMWVADMDFQVAAPILEAVVDRARHGIYGYSHRDDAYYRAVVDWLQRRHGWEIHRDWIVNTPGVVPAIAQAVMAFTGRGDKVLIQEPVYYPFRKTTEGLGREIVVNPLVLEEGRYRMDFADLEQKAADPDVKMLILCSPHNPVGRVWTEEELRQLGEICVKYDVLVVSDEIHNDLVMPGYRHTVLATLSPQLADRTITCVAVSKTFNLAGMQASSIIISNDLLRDEYQRQLERHRVGGQNPFSIVATTAAYNQCEDWVDQAVAYIAGNFQTLALGLAARLPLAKVYPLEGTYLAWVDFSAYLTGPDQPEVEVGKKAGVAFDGGDWFGMGGQGHLRINLACPRSIVDRALSQLGDAFGGR